jgi:spore coat polysaccharide biosynthesis protein SpsF
MGIIVAARMSSVRLPGKALLPLHGLPMVVFLLRRLRGTKMGDVILATTTLSADDQLTDTVEAEDVPVFRGSATDVVARYVGAAKQFGFDTVARVTADCPFIDAELADWCIGRTAEFDRFDLATTKGMFPVGLDIEIYQAERLATLDAGGQLTATDREHLTLHFYNHSDEFDIRIIKAPPAWAHTERHFTVDTKVDYDGAKHLVEKIGQVGFSISVMLNATQ